MHSTSDRIWYLFPVNCQKELVARCWSLAITNGIEELATRGDLLDRSISPYLPSIEEEGRRSETEFWTDYYGARPRIFGGAEFWGRY